MNGLLAITHWLLPSGWPHLYKQLLQAGQLRTPQLLLAGGFKEALRPESGPVGVLVHLAVEAQATAIEGF